jgi:hypothetical protein
MLKKITINSSNAEVYVSGYSTSINGEDLSMLLHKHLSDDEFSNNFRGKVTIIIEELETELSIQSNKVFKEQKDEHEIEE